MRLTHIFPEQQTTDGDTITRAVGIELPDSPRKRLWYRFPVELSPYITDSLDPFLIGSIFIGMQAGHQIRVHGTISTSLIRNLTEFQAYWYCLLPQKYTRVEIYADDEREAAPAQPIDRSICAFTGGVDSSYTMYRHRTAMCKRLTRNIEAGLFVHGFDVPLSDSDAFIRAARVNEESLLSVGVKLFTMASNHRELNEEWNETHGSGVGSCLAFFQRHFPEGIIPSTYCYSHLSGTWGSNPITDPLMSSDAFRMFHDGAVWTRSHKLVPLSRWAEGYKRLRVCYSAPEKDKNCCKCGKCVLTVLTMKLYSTPVPESFPEELCDETFLCLNDLDEPQLQGFEAVFELLAKMRKRLPYAGALEHCIHVNQRRLRGSCPSEKPVVDRLRRTGDRVKSLLGFATALPRR